MTGAKGQIPLSGPSNDATKSSEPSQPRLTSTSPPLGRTDCQNAPRGRRKRKSKAVAPFRDETTYEKRRLWDPVPLRLLGAVDGTAGSTLDLAIGRPCTRGVPAGEQDRTQDGGRCVDEGPCEGEGGFWREEWRLGRVVVTSMNQLFCRYDYFCGCADLCATYRAFNEPLNNWNTSAVTDMRNMFWGASSFDQSIGSWNTGAVTDIAYIFKRASSFNQDLSAWQVSPSTSIYEMFFTVCTGLQLFASPSRLQARL